jgi:LysR family transcriptional regulator (chromosome initiation inhibitor)
LFWQHWRLGSALVDDLTDAVVGAARGWMSG